MAEDTQEKKIIVDEDWKEEAQREKEMLAQAMEEEKRQQARPPEKASFGLLVSSLATQALISLGEVENPFTKKREVNTDEARFHIDMLEMLEEKTKNNLEPNEANLLKNLLFDLRMRFVNKTK
jgi:uncharacterized protein DUF1844